MYNVSQRGQREWKETYFFPFQPQLIYTELLLFLLCDTALTINLGPTFLSGALAAQAEIIPHTPSCPLVRGPARHSVLNALWAAVNLLCIGLAVNHLRKLKKDLGKSVNNISTIALFHYISLNPPGPGFTFY